MISVPATKVPVITVDGPSGTGKGTICSYLADWLQWHFLDSGALYRVLALAAEKHGISSDNEAALAKVRQALLSRQRAFHLAPGLIADGRDMGTVVFPGATLKIYLTASAEERAKRRYKQLKEKGIDATLRDLSAAIAERDERDSTRAASPLKPAEDAIVIDTSKLDIDAVLENISELVRNTVPGLQK